MSRFTNQYQVVIEHAVDEWPDDRRRGFWDAVADKELRGIDPATALRATFETFQIMYE